MQNNNDIQSLTIKALFESNEKFRIPIYQRNYAWGKGQVEQLIQDILDFSECKSANSYYIGTLVVFERKDGNTTIYETIDGQQRLTTLSILLSVLKNDFKSDFGFNHILSYESRAIANKTFESIYNDRDFADDCNATMRNAYETIKAKLSKMECSQRESFRGYLLEKVEILRVNVPQDTDLNHYFEIMNNRGEQLEKHEVLKSQMLSKLDEANRKVFAKIWDACSDMSRYVQYGFSPDERKHVFGDNWGELELKSFDEFNMQSQNSTDTNSDNNKDKNTLENIIKSNKIDYPISDNDKKISERFTSPINFQNFLLHVLRIQVMNDKRENISFNEREDIPLDDKRLIDIFSVYIGKVGFVKEFVYNLLKLRFLFDNFIIKREYTGDTGEDGSWSLKKLIQNKSAQYNNSFGSDEDNNPNEKLIKLLSMFHVSNPSMIYKHWLTAVLNYLYNRENIGDISADDYINYLEDLAEKFFRNRYIANEPAEYHEIIFTDSGLNNDINIKELDKGTAVENFVFNYLDYLLWKSNKQEYDKFEFTFRSSVEHFYPQNPLDGQNKLEDEVLNSFGNLCLISTSKNSKFSNLQPEGKKSHYNGFDGVSPKQFLMMDKAEGWSTSEISKHQNEMLKILGIQELQNAI
ncbi:MULTISPECIES: DUF262 domain-containing protein [unclassified Francisella]|uniref:DUF262 domain-containing protein n=1 Tax=unclassified Francisella TaxID=2610885 RepID=UPI002E3329CE|nr:MULTISPECIES: DUF262 domain-containing HNH endonuclease family protein [unclassified Francisella]MED7818503.1 DUF262 domain-containing HNH endonuclease family protein [Francisella sp. 19S2-4]MED7829339.1 DUF262 domain-containing HNH endonuclease family protein [Francisella sp. 19S2-10]